MGKYLYKKNIHSQVEIFLGQCCPQLVRFYFPAGHLLGDGNRNAENPIRAVMLVGILEITQPLITTCGERERNALLVFETER